MQKVLVLGRMKEFLRNVIISYCANFWAKLHINFEEKCQFCAKKKIEIFGEMLTFVHYNRKSLFFFSKNAFVPTEYLPAE